MRGKWTRGRNERAPSARDRSRTSIRFGRVVIGAVLFFLASLLAEYGAAGYRADASASGDAPGGEIRVHTIQTLRHKNWVTSLAWSPDGKLLATAGLLSHDITIWDTETGQIVHALYRQRGMGQSLAFMGDGRYLLTSAATDEPGVALSLWDLNTGKITRQIPGLFPVKGVAYNGARIFAVDPNQKLVAAVAEQGLGYPVTFFDTKHWRLVNKLSIPKVAAYRFVIAPDAKSIAVGTITGYIKIFDIPTLTLRRTIDAYVHDDAAGVESLAFSPDGRFIASGATNPYVKYREADPARVAAPPWDPIRIWNLADGSFVQSFTGKLGVVRSLAWSPSGQYVASANSDRTVRLWRVDSKSTEPSSAATVVMTFPRDAAYAVAFSPDGKRLAACGQSTAIISEIER